MSTTQSTRRLRGRESFPRVAVLDAATLGAFRRREEGAVKALYQHYGPLVYGVAHSVLGRHELAEEAVQQTFVRAWQAADEIDLGLDPAPWLSTIAKRAAIDIFRRESRRSVALLDEVAAHDPAVVTLPPELDRLDAVWQVRRAIDALEPDEATVVRLQHLEGLSHTEIAHRLDIAVGTVKSRSHRAHRKLVSLLGHLRSVSHG